MDKIQLTFNKILRDWGVDVFLQRRIYRSGAGAFSLPAATPNINASESYYTSNLERWTCRYTFAARKTGLSDTSVGRTPGIEEDVPLVFYFPAASHIKEQDRIYVQDSNQPNSFSTWIVNYVEKVIGWRNQIAYLSVGAYRENAS